MSIDGRQQLSSRLDELSRLRLLPSSTAGVREALEAPGQRSADGAASLQAATGEEGVEGVDGSPGTGHHACVPGPLPHYTGSDTRLDDDEGQGLAVLISAVLGVALWAACWGWDTPFAYVGDRGMFGGPYGSWKFLGCVVAVPAVGLTMGYRNHPWAGAAGLTASFSSVWSADAFITYSNPSFLLGVIPLWAFTTAGAFLSAWSGLRLRLAALERSEIRGRR